MITHISTRFSFYVIVLIITAFSAAAKSSTYFDEVAITIPYDIALPAEYTSAKLSCSMAEIKRTGEQRVTWTSGPDTTSLMEISLANGRAKGDLVYGYGNSATNVSGNQKHFRTLLDMEVFKPAVQALLSEENFKVGFICQIFELKANDKIFSVKNSSEHGGRAIFEKTDSSETFVRKIENSKASWRISLTPSNNNNQGSIEELLLDFDSDNEPTMIFNSGNG